MASKKIGQKDDEACSDCLEKVRQEGLEKYLSVLSMKTAEYSEANTYSTPAFKHLANP